MDDIRQNRKELQYTYSEYAKLEDGDPKKLDTADKLNLMFEEASVNYNNVMAMLPLAIEDIKTRLLLGDGQKKKDEAPLSIGVLSMDEHGELKILEAPKENKKELMVLDDNANAGLIQAIEKDYMDLNEDGNEYVMSLVARTFCPLASTMELSLIHILSIPPYLPFLCNEPHFPTAELQFPHSLLPSRLSDTEPSPCHFPHGKTLPCH